MRGGLPYRNIAFLLFCFFFFSSRRRHTRSLCDWSSDVCSSDLPYSAWVIAFDAGTLKQTGAIDLVPNNSGGGMWMGGGGPAADATGNVYVISGDRKSVV